MEHLIYAACLENATFEQADEAFSVLEHHYIDWNEIRVSTAAELAYTFPHLPDAMVAGERIRKTLQAVFEATYRFELEDLRKKNLSQAVDFLGSLGVCSRFMVDYTTHNALGGHVIPLDESALRVFRILGLAQTNKENTREVVGGLERAIPKQEGHEFANLLHNFAVEFYQDTALDNLQQLLKSIDPQAVNRDWTAPVLVVVKPVKLVKQKPVIPPIAAATVLDDDLDTTEEGRDVEEVEFIPNPITGEESSFEVGDDDGDGRPVKSTLSSKTSSKAAKKGAASSKKAGPKKTDAKELAPKKEVALKTETKKAESQPPEEPVPTPQTKSKEVKKKEGKKEDKEKTEKPETPPPPKKSSKKSETPVKPKTDSKANIAKKDAKKTPESTPPPKPKKSPIRMLRQKKPK